MVYSPDRRIHARFLKEGGDVVSANERHLLQLIWRNPGISRSEITALIDLTQPSVYRIIDQLAERGIVVLGAPKPGQGRGQPSPALGLDGSYAYSCGISLNTDLVGICLMDLSGQVLGEATVVLRETTRQQALELVRQEIEKLQASRSLDAERLFGIGFAIAGWQVDGTRFNAPLPLHDWSLIELGPLLADFFGRPVWVNNGANTGAMAEAMVGVGRHIKHFAYLSFNYGFGGGLISNGELLVGGNGNAGSFSGMFDEEERNRRPALQFLIDRLRKQGVDVPSISYMRGHFDPHWPGVTEWIDEITPAYNRLVNAIMAIFDPQAIVFGGEVPPALAGLMIERTRSFSRPRYGIVREQPKLIVSQITSDASALGGAIVPFREAFY